jgi:nicotinamide-nucleotide amidase
MKAEILMIGTELLLGQIVDTNAAFLAQTMAENGIHIYQKTTVGDNQARIVAALRGALERSDVVLCSGGLGPTEDDITRECVAEVFGVGLSFREDLYNSVLDRFRNIRVQITENNKKQAFLPEGAEAIENPRGTAPGLIMAGPQGAVVCMPGVPHELEGMMRDSVVPWLRQRFGLSGVLHYRSLKVCGIGESRIDALIGDLITSQVNPTIGLLANPEATRIRIAAHAPTLEEADAMIDAVEAKVQERLPGLIMGRDTDTIEAVVTRLLVERGWKLRLIEQSTGGMIAQRLAAAGGEGLAGGVVLPPGTVEEGVEPGEKVLALAREALLGSAELSVLSVLQDPAHRRSIAAFASPLGEFSWDIGDYAKGQRNQLRAVVYCLERVRRILLGVTAET